MQNTSVSDYFNQLRHSIMVTPVLKTILLIIMALALITVMPQLIIISVDPRFGTE